MQLNINGQARDFSTPLTIEQLLERLNLPQDRVVVELNKQILTSEDLSRTLSDGDALELIQFVGGG